MTKVLVSIQDNWADEFDFAGFQIFDNMETWEEVKAGIPEGSHDAYLGTNEECQYKSREDYLAHLHVAEITDEEEAVIRRVLGMKQWKTGYGLFVIRSENY